MLFDLKIKSSKQLYIYLVSFIKFSMESTINDITPNVRHLNVRTGEDMRK